MREHSWKSEACGFINFEITIKTPPSKVLKDRISARKESITSKNFKAFLKILTRS